MISCATVNKKGECILDEYLFSKTNFSVREKKGFYCQKKKKYLKYKQIYPINFPLTREEAERFRADKSNDIS